MSCKKCVFIPRTSFTSSLFKVLVTLKLLHGSRAGARGSSLEDIAMYMIKHFCLDGDVKSQVLASLKYGVKMNFIQKKKDKFSLIMPSSAIHLAPCKYKNEEIERIRCIYPPAWYSSNCAGSDVCSQGEHKTCCGQRGAGRSKAIPCCKFQDESEDDDTCSQPSCSRQSKKSSSHSVCKCQQKKKKKKSRPVCPPILPPKCHRGKKRRTCAADPFDFCQYCPPPLEEQNKKCLSSYPHSAYTNCTCCDK